MIIDRRFRGPPESGNGGYACGLVASFISGAPAVEVTLREPPPLDAPLSVKRVNGGIELLDGETLVAEGRGAEAPVLELPDPVGLDEAERAQRSSPLHEDHAFPGCFVCGPDREAGDGLGIVCGPVPGRENELIAAPWHTRESMGDEAGRVRSELVWSALDCPSGLTGMLIPGLGVIVLGRLTGQLLAPLDAGETYVAIGWPIERDGRKLRSATAILDRSGEPLANASATWIELRDQPAATSTETA